MTNPDNVGGLLPCPFCGAEPKLAKCVGYDQGQSSISCANCDVYMMDIHSHVIETWNRRELCRAAPAGSGEVEQMAKRLDDAREIEEETSGLEDTIDAMRTAAALLRKLQQGAE